MPRETAKEKQRRDFAQATGKDIDKLPQAKNPGPGKFNAAQKKQLQGKRVILTISPMKGQEPAYKIEARGEGGRKATGTYRNKQTAERNLKIQKASLERAGFRVKIIRGKGTKES